MARTPQKATRNPSRAAGRVAPASAAAKAPMAGFYSPDGNVPMSPLAAPVPESVEPQVRGFTGTVQDTAIAIERGGSADREVVERLAQDAVTDPNDLAAEIARIRSIRKPIGAYSQKLALPERPGYKRHWFNDIAGRVEEAGANGWAHVKGSDEKPICRCVGTGRDKGAMYAYAMEIPMVFWVEDMNARNAAAKACTDGLKAQPFRAAPGTAQKSDSGKFYSPDDTGSAPLNIEVH